MTRPSPASLGGRWWSGCPSDEGTQSVSAAQSARSPGLTPLYLCEGGRGHAAHVGQNQELVKGQRPRRYRRQGEPGDCDVAPAVGIQRLIRNDLHGDLTEEGSFALAVLNNQQRSGDDLGYPQSRCRRRPVPHLGVMKDGNIVEWNERDRVRVRWGGFWDRSG